jgi:D-lactate dehydrogenase
MPTTTIGSSASPADLALMDSLACIVAPERVLIRPIERIAYASDASFYRLIPQAVVLARDVEEIQGLFQFSHVHRMPMTFRAAGTSLSGQAVTEGILVEVAKHWRHFWIEDGGKKVRVQPGVIGGSVNQGLMIHRAKIGPDPASINACMMGGILANNSSGMCCGVAQNAYHTLHSLTFVLPSGTMIDTAHPDADMMFRQREPRLAQGLLEIQREIKLNPGLADRIRAKYKMKNTTGYSLNSFLDFERPVDIFRNLLIGSEGTLAFIAEAVLNTVPELPVKYTGLLLFPSIHAACAAIAPLRDANAKAVELMDRASLRSVERQVGIPTDIKGLPMEAAGLLVEFQAADEKDRATLEELARQAVGSFPLLKPGRFTHDKEEQALLWKIRQGLYPSVGAARKRGTTVIIEDVVFPIPCLAGGAAELIRTAVKHGYEDAILFGHARDGNLHLTLTQSYNTQAEVDRYARFMDDMVSLVVARHDGALKGEHGTGRNIAPFVETEWGREAYAIMKRLKNLVDPEGLLNPGVILNPDPKAHISNLKSLPEIEDEVDKCIECGYCESRCPSQDLTLTPRQRIVVRREMTRLECYRHSENTIEINILRSLEDAFPYMALDTCAVDGLCATACPVSINTGDLVKRFRRLRHSNFDQHIALLLAKRFAFLESAMRLGLWMGHAIQSLLGIGAMTRISRAIRWITRQPFPQWSREMPRPTSERKPVTQKVGAYAIYFPSCISRVMGHLPGEVEDVSIMEAFITLAQRAERPVWIPEAVEGTCCGVPFSSKGYDRAHAFAVNKAIERFWEWSFDGKLSIVVDTSPCTYALTNCRPYLTAANQQRFDRITILDGITFVHDEILPRLTVRKRFRSVALHPVCSVVKMDLTEKLANIASFCCDQVTIPTMAGCCGFAGDRGFLFPELTESATRREADEVVAGQYEGHYSSSRTCEIGMTRATGYIYRSYIYLLERATHT